MSRRRIPTLPVYDKPDVVHRNRTTVRINSLLVHDTGVKDLFEYSKHTDGQPRGPAWFWLYGQEDQDARFCAMYRDSNNVGLRRRIIYTVVDNPSLRNLSTIEAREEFLEEVDEARTSAGIESLPTIVRGRTSLIDRWGSFSEECTEEARLSNYSAFIRGFLTDQGFEGTLEADGVVCLFNPKKFINIFTVKPVDDHYSQVYEYMNGYIPSECKTFKEYYKIHRKLYPHANLRSPPIFTLKEKYVAPETRCTLTP